MKCGAEKPKPNSSQHYFMNANLSAGIGPVLKLLSQPSLAALTSVDDWAERINAVSTESVASAIEAGQLLHAARIALKHGEWSKLFRDGRLTLSKRTAEKRMTIAESCGAN